jgi:hypothetical protein
MWRQAQVENASVPSEVIMKRNNSTVVVVLRLNPLANSLGNGDREITQRGDIRLRVNAASKDKC